MNIENKTILITGANRGIGRALLEEALRRGAKRVYAGTRNGALQNADERVTPVTLDVTSAEQIEGAVKNIESLDILINNAGVDLHDDLGDRAGLERHLAVNLFGTWGVTQAFLPLLARSQGGIVNVLSLAALECAVQSSLLDLEGGRILVDAIAARSLGGPRRDCSCHFRWPCGHRYDPGPKCTEDPSRICRTSHLRRSRERRGGHLSRSHVSVHR
jgi:NAD(P)-dependent dehydrogenase (short-subunit alcohol dehydrogenase family)